jgi:NADH-quinone oxidoreductase subunit L
MILAGLSVVGGFVGIPLIEGAHVFKDFLSPAITPVAHHAAAHPTATFEVCMMLFSMAVAGLGIYTAYKYYILRPELPGIFTEKFRTIYDLVYNKYFVDEIYDTIVVEPIKEGSNFLWNVVDAKGVDGVVNGSAGIIAYLSAHLRKLETGFVQNYALAILLGVVVITGYLIGR